MFLEPTISVCIFCQVPLPSLGKCCCCLVTKSYPTLLQSCSPLGSSARRIWGFQDMASLRAQMVKNLPSVQETWVQFLGQEDPRRRKILKAEEPSGGWWVRMRLSQRLLWVWESSSREPRGSGVHGAFRVGTV